MSHTSKEEYLESCRQRYPSRNRAGKSAMIDEANRAKILSYSPRTLERITAPHRGASNGRIGRKTGRASNRIKKLVPIRCGPQAFDEPSWLEVDTLSHGGSSSSGAFLWSLTLTDFHSGWTELAALWGNSGGDNYPDMISKAAKKPIRIYQQDGSNDLNNQFGSWTEANKAMVAAFEKKGYDHQFVLGEGVHSGRHGTALFPDAMRWMWRDYPKD